MSHLRGPSTLGVSSRIQLRLVLSFLSIFASVFILVGCGDSQSGLSTSAEPKDTAQADFDWAMERLRRAVETFTPSANLGLRVKREFSYEFHPPSASQPNYTAQVTIKSKTFYKPERYVPAATEEKNIGAGPQASESAFAEEMLANRANDPSDFFDADGAFPSRRPMIVESQIPAPRIDKLNVYELTYRDGRWQLDTQPESKHAQMLFDYALQQ